MEATTTISGSLGNWFALGGCASWYISQSRRLGLFDIYTGGLGGALKLTHSIEATIVKNAPHFQALLETVLL